MGKQKERPKSWKELSTTFKKNDWEEDWRPPFIVFQWGCEWTTYWLSRLALLEVLEYLGKLSLLVALIVWIYPGCKERRLAAESAKQAAADARESKHFVAWQTINSAVGKSGDGGRANALQDLNKDGVSLVGVDLTGWTYDENINLAEAKMGWANMTKVRLVNPFFTEAYLSSSSLERATIERGNFQHARLDFVNYTNADLDLCDFSSSHCWSDKVQNTRFFACNFASVDKSICATSHKDVRYIGCNFANAKFTFVLNEDTSQLIFSNRTMIPLMFYRCNFYGAKAAPYFGSDFFLNWATNEAGGVWVPITNSVEWTSWLYQHDKDLAEEIDGHYEHGFLSYMHGLTNK